MRRPVFSAAHSVARRCDLRASSAARKCRPRWRARAGLEARLSLYPPQSTLTLALNSEAKEETNLNLKN